MVSKKTKKLREKAASNIKKVKSEQTGTVSTAGGRVTRGSRTGTPKGKRSTTGSVSGVVDVQPNEILRNERGSVIGFTDASGVVKRVGETQSIQQAGSNQLAQRNAGGVGGVTTQQDEQQVSARPELEAAGAFEQVTPRKVSLAPETAGFGGEEGIFAPTVGATQSVLFNALQDKFPKEIARIRGDQFGEIPPETARELALRKIREKSFKKGVSQAESIGALLEAIPFIGGNASKYARGLTQTPSPNADKVLKEIEAIEQAASTGQEKVRNGLEDPDYGLGRARQMEEQVAKLEGRMKALINTSAVLRANSDQVNLIEEQILEARERIARYRRASAFGLTAQLTGTGRVIPTDEQLFFELKGG